MLLGIVQIMEEKMYIPIQEDLSLQILMRVVRITHNYNVTLQGLLLIVLAAASFLILGSFYG